MTLKNIWTDNPDRSRGYKIVDNTFSAITHGIGFGLSIAGLVLLIIKAAQSSSAIKVISFTLYGISLILLYLFSTLYHSLIFTRSKKVFQVFDHS